MGLINRVLGRRPATTLAADDSPSLPPQGEALGEFGGPTTTSYVQKQRERLGELLNTSKLTPRLITAMREHPQVSSCLAAHAFPLYRADWTIECEDDAIREDITARWAAVHARFMRTFARAGWAGFTPNALVWDVDDQGGWVITGVRDLDPFTCTPVVDDAGSYEGFYQRSPRNGDRIDIDPLQSFWGVEGLESGNLYGRSLLVAARQAWQDQQTVGLYHLRYLERFGEPTVVARGPAGEVDVNEVARQNAIIWNAEHPEQPVEVPPVKMMSKLDQALAIGENLRHHSVVALPSAAVMAADGKLTTMPEWSLEYLSAGSADGSAFLDKIADLDRAIARAMLVPSLLMEGGDTVGSNALGQSHRSTFVDSVESRLDDYAAQLNEHVLDRLVTFNYGPNAPRARLKFAPLADATIEKLWTLVTALVTGGALPLDVAAIAARLGIPLVDVEDEPAAASPFMSVGLPALVAAGIMSEEEARAFVGLEGPAPEKPVVDAAFAMARAGRTDLARVVLGLAPRALGPAPAAVALAHDHELAAAVPDVGNLPPWKQPAAYDPGAFRRELTPREQRVGFAKLENELNTAEARAVDQLVALLEQSHEKVARQVQGIMRKGGTVADIVAALDTVNVGPVGPWAAVWVELQRAVWGFGLDSVRRELADFADAVPGSIGRDGQALVAAYAAASADRTLAELATRTRLELISAFRSGVSTTGMVATVANLYDQVTRSEAAAPRLTTRMLAAKALNESRADAIQRGGIPLQGAQYSAILDKRTCDLCERLDEQLIAIADTDFAKFTAPLHHNCRCVWVYVAAGEADFTPTWSSPPKSLVDSFGGLVFGS